MTVLASWRLIPLVGSGLLEEVPQDKQCAGRRAEMNQFPQAGSDNQAGRDVVQEIHLREHRPADEPATPGQGPEERDSMSLPAQDGTGAENVQNQMGYQRGRPGSQESPVQGQVKGVCGNPGERDQGGQDQDRMARLPMGPAERYSPKAGKDIEVRQATGNSPACPECGRAVYPERARDGPSNPNTGDYVSDR